MIKATASFTDLDQASEMIFTTFKSSSILCGSWGNSETWLEL
jgi:hypothetical protein